MAAWWFWVGVGGDGGGWAGLRRRRLEQVWCVCRLARANTVFDALILRWDTHLEGVDGDKVREEGQHVLYAQQAVWGGEYG
jgi:hypothetical protein